MTPDSASTRLRWSWYIFSWSSISASLVSFAAWSSLASSSAAAASVYLVLASSVGTFSSSAVRSATRFSCVATVTASFATAGDSGACFDSSSCSFLIRSVTVGCSPRFGPRCASASVPCRMSASCTFARSRGFHQRRRSARRSVANSGLPASSNANFPSFCRCTARRSQSNSPRLASSGSLTNDTAITAVTMPATASTSPPMSSSPSGHVSSTSATSANGSDPKISTPTAANAPSIHRAVF
jgi:hypothetical protein